jgi:hypothetical protein
VSLFRISLTGLCAALVLIGPAEAGPAAARPAAARPAAAEPTTVADPAPSTVDSPESSGGPVPIGQPARDRDFALTVTAVDCGKQDLAPDAPDTKPQGQFCVVKLTARNAASRTLRFTLSVFRQSAYAPDGTRYAVSSAATEDASQGKNPFIVQVNPGNEVPGVLVFDIPKTSSVAKLKLYESVISPGVEVTV